MGLFDFWKKKKKQDEPDALSEEEQGEVLEQLDSLGEQTVSDQSETPLAPSTESFEPAFHQAEEDFAEVLPEANAPVIVQEEFSPALEEDATVDVSLIEEDPSRLTEFTTSGENNTTEEEPSTAIQDDVLQESAEHDTTDKKGFFARFLEGLRKTRDAITGQIDAILNSFTTIDEDLLEELEEVLIMSDVGADTALEIVQRLRVRIKQTGEKNPKNLKVMIRDIVAEMLEGDYTLHLEHKPAVLLMIGVNGAGKTTSTGKLAYRFQKEGKHVVLAAADTFRAAAIDQLAVWADRAGAELVRHQEGSDPAAVVFDAIAAGKARGADIIVCDTAGRLHNKKNLMEELAKIRRIIDRELPDASVESLLVLDATTGQNALNQARQFKEVADITGIVLTKLDGTAKGGVVIGIKNELGIPVKYIGVGEQIEDLRPFDPVAFASALFYMED